MLPKHHDTCTAASLTVISGGPAKAVPHRGMVRPIKSDENGLSSCFITRAVTYVLMMATRQDTVSDSHWGYRTLSRDPTAVRGNGGLPMGVKGYFSMRRNGVRVSGNIK